MSPPALDPPQRIETEQSDQTEPEPDVEVDPVYRPTPGESFQERRRRVDQQETLRTRRPTRTSWRWTSPGSTASWQETETWWRPHVWCWSLFVRCGEAQRDVAWRMELRWEIQSMKMVSWLEIMSLAEPQPSRLKSFQWMLQTCRMSMASLWFKVRERSMWTMSCPTWLTSSLGLVRRSSRLPRKPHRDWLQRCLEIGLCEVFGRQLVFPRRNTWRSQQTSTNGRWKLKTTWIGQYFWEWSLGSGDRTSQSWPQSHFASKVRLEVGFRWKRRSTCESSTCSPRFLRPGPLEGRVEYIQSNIGQRLPTGAHSNFHQWRLAEVGRRCCNGVSSRRSSIKNFVGKDS